PSVATIPGRSGGRCIETVRHREDGPGHHRRSRGEHESRALELFSAGFRPDIVLGRPSAGLIVDQRLVRHGAPAETLSAALRRPRVLMLRFTTAGESHGQALISVLEGIPAGLSLLAEHIDEQLARRQQGYGRGRRMQIEKDAVELLSGVRAGETIGSPVAMLIRNRDWKNWQEIMDASLSEEEAAAASGVPLGAATDEGSARRTDGSRPLRRRA